MVIKTKILIIFCIVPFLSVAKVEFNEIKESDILLFTQLKKMQFTGFRKEDSKLKLKEIQTKYRILKKYKALPSYEDLKEDKNRMQVNSKFQKKLKTIFGFLKTENKILKYFVFPQLVDRYLEKLYKNEKKSQTTKSLALKSKLDEVIRRKIKFKSLINVPGIKLGRVIFKSSNEQKEIPLGRGNASFVETLYGSVIKVWKDEIIDTRPMKVGSVFWGREKVYEWEVIRVVLANPDNGHYEFETLKVGKRNLEDWLKFESKSM